MGFVNLLRNIVTLQKQDYLLTTATITYTQQFGMTLLTTFGCIFYV